MEQKKFQIIIIMMVLIIMWEGPGMNSRVVIIAMQGIKEQSHGHGNYHDDQWDLLLWTKSKKYFIHYASACTQHVLQSGEKIMRGH